MSIQDSACEKYINTLQNVIKHKSGGVTNNSACTFL